MHALSEYLLPQPEERPRGKLLLPLALSSYFIFLIALIFSTRLLAFRLPGVLGFASNIQLGDLVTLVNQKRAENGASSVQLNEVLNEVARMKAEDMFAKGYWDHVSPDGVQPWDFFSRAGYDYIYAGENLAKDFQDSAGVVEAWMNSPTHRDNLINPKYEDMGLAVVNGSLNGYETTLVVQEFGKRKVEPTLAAVPQAQAATTEREPEPIQEEVVPSLVKESPSPPVPAVREEPPVVKLETIPAPTVIAEPLPEAVVSLPVVDIFSASKAIAFLLGGFLALLFLIDGYFVFRQGFVPRLSGHTLAHLGLLVLAMIGIWYVNSGVIL